MISAGETKKVVGPYQANPLTPTSDSAVIIANADGTPSDYVGERIETCSEATGTRAINDVQLTAAEAQAMRTDLDIAPRFLHLNADKMTPGSYCLYYKDYEQGLANAKKLDCGIFGETWIDGVVGWLPGTDHTRCQQVELAMAPDYKPKVLKVLEGVAYIALGAGTMVAGGYGFFMGGDIYNARKAAKVAKVAQKAAAKAEAAVAKKAAAEVAEEVADIADGKVARAAVGEAVEEGAEHGAAPILRAVTSEAAEEGVEHGVGTGARVAVRKAVGETVEAGAKAAGKTAAKTVLKGAAKGLGIFAGFGVALVGGLLFPDEAEASEADRAMFGEAFDNYGDFDGNRAMARNCEQSTLCYIGHLALKPVGIIADFSSESAY